MKRFSAESGLARRIIVAKVNKNISVRIERNAWIIPIPTQAYAKSISFIASMYHAKEPLSAIKQSVVHKEQKLTPNYDNIFLTNHATAIYGNHT